MMKGFLSVKLSAYTREPPWDSIPIKVMTIVF